MLYSRDNFLTPDALQSWFVVARDQATMQLIAASSMQHQIEVISRKTVESSAMLLEQERELPFAVSRVKVAVKAKGTQRRDRSVQ